MCKFLLYAIFMGGIVYFFRLCRGKREIMKTRVISACVLIILVVACFAISPVTRILFLLAALIMGIWEMCHAVSLKDIKCTSWVLYIYAVLATAGIFLMEGNSRSVMLFFLAVFAVFTVGLPEILKGNYIHVFILIFALIFWEIISNLLGYPT